MIRLRTNRHRLAAITTNHLAAAPPRMATLKPKTVKIIFTFLDLDGSKMNMAKQSADHPREQRQASAKQSASNKQKKITKPSRKRGLFLCPKASGAASSNTTHLVGGNLL